METAFVTLRRLVVAAALFTGAIPGASPSGVAFGASQFVPDEFVGGSIMAPNGQAQAVHEAGADGPRSKPALSLEIAEQTRRALERIRRDARASLHPMKFPAIAAGQPQPIPLSAAVAERSERPGP